MPDTPDSITIDGVTISREQWEVFHVAYTLYAAHLTWEAFVAANKPEHYDGEPCELPVWSGDKELAKGIRFEYTGRKTSSYTINNWSAVNGKIMWGPHTAVLWELRAVRIQPAPKYKVGDWVVVPGWKPIQVSKVEWGRTDYFYYIEKNRAFTKSHLRPATREDFMAEFGDVKVWMEKRAGRIRLNHRDTETTSYGDGWCYVEEWQVAINHAAGVMEMPKEFWI